MTELHCALIILSGFIISMIGAVYPIYFPADAVFGTTGKWNIDNGKQGKIYKEKYIRSLSISRSLISLGLTLQYIGSLLSK